jgi:hypothetical protein
MSRPVIVSKVLEATAGTIVDPSGELRKYGVQGADIASAATINLPSASGDYVRVTGTTNISNLGSGVAGMVRTVEFTGILTLIYNSTNLILPGAVNMVTAPNDVAIFRCRGGNAWICISYQTAAGTAPIQMTPEDVGLGNVENIKLSTWPGSANLTTLGTVTGGIWQATPIAPNKGGTGLTAVSQGDMIYADAANSIKRLPKNTTQSRYLSNQGGLDNSPDWQLVNLANGVTGILAGANGGRGALVQTPAAPTGVALAIDLALGNFVILGLGSATGNVTLTFSGATPGLLSFLYVTQGATIRALIFPAGSKQTLLGGTTWNPSGANKTDIITFVYDNSFCYILGTAPDMG